MSKNFEKYKYNYLIGFYTKAMLKMLIGKNGFTKEEYDIIIALKE